MVLNNCTVCSVYVPEDGALRRIRVKCAGDRITLFLKRENELPDSERIRIDFFDGQIGCIKTYCELIVRRNNDSSAAEPWIADCEIRMWLRSYRDGGICGLRWRERFR